MEEKQNLSLDEKKFFDYCLISNTNGLLDWFNPSEKNQSELVGFAYQISLEQLKVRREMYSFNKIKKREIAKEKINLEEVVDIFNLTCVDLSRASKLTEERENLVLKILKDYTLEDIGVVFKNVSESDYLCGKKVSWKASFDWILTEKNFINILEGKYKNIENGQNNNNKNYTASCGIQEKIAKKLFPI